MVKSITTIYIESQLLEEAKIKKLNLSSLCEEAIKLSLNGVEGSVSGGLKNFLNHQAEKNKDLTILKRLRERNSEKFNPALRVFCEKYSVDTNHALKEMGF